MTHKTIHIVSFDVPYPPNYGGIIDVYYKIKALYDRGFEVILHCYEYGRGIQKPLEAICKEVHYYKRKTGLKNLFSRKPYIVNSRINASCERNLLSDNFPIIIEGLHNAWILENDMLAQRSYIRMHNIEHAYYKGLASNSSGFKKMFFNIESQKLKRYESIISKARAVFAISEYDLAYFANININSILLLPFFNAKSLENSEKQSNPYMLIHGNFNVPENLNALHWLNENVIGEFPDKHFIVAGSFDILPSKLITSNIELLKNPSDDELEHVLANAEIHLFYSNQKTGIKLKLLNALRTSGIIIANDSFMVENELKEFMHIAGRAEDYIDLIKRNKMMDASKLEDRKDYLSRKFNQVETIIKTIEGKL